MKTYNRQGAAPGRRHTQGLSLIELMISLVLGLLVVGAAISVFLSNGQTYRATESLGRVQENARVAFELMARDIREAGGNPCGKNLPVANVINASGSRWWTNWGDGIRGVDGPFAAAEPANRLAGTSAVELMSGQSTGATVSKQAGATFHLSTSDHGIEPDDIVLVCDNRQAAIFQVTNSNPANKTVVHNTGGGTVGNCTHNGLGVPVPINCSASNFSPYEYGPNSVLVKLGAVRWYVGTNVRGNSLYRSVMRNGALGAPEEVTEGVEDMQITYLLPGSSTYVDAAAVGTRWKEVLAARIDVSLEGADRVGTGGEVIERQLTHVVTLRNRNA